MNAKIFLVDHKNVNKNQKYKLYGLFMVIFWFIETSVEKKDDSR